MSPAATSTRVARFDFHGRLDGVTRTPQGGIRATANLTRTGIFRYQTEDGAPFLEFRPSSEVFDSKSLETLKHAPLTIGHPSEVNSGNWKQLAVGHVAEDVRANGNFVTATVIVQDAETCAKIERGELRELSCGYEVELDMTPGEHEGERYDATQRNPRYNHVAIGGTDWGRAGRDVRINLDAAYAHDVNQPIKRADAPVSRTDAPTNTATNHDADGMRRDLDAVRADNDRLRAERDAAVVRADKADAEKDTAKKALADAETKQKADEASFDARVEKRVQLVADAKDVLGDTFDVKGKSDKDIRIACITKIDPKFDAKDKNDAYIEARLDFEMPKVRKDKSDLAGVARGTSEQTLSLPTTVTQTNEDTKNESAIDKARREMNERHQNAWKPKA